MIHVYIDNYQYFIVDCLKFIYRWYVMQLSWWGGAERSDPMVFRIIFDYLIATKFIGLIAISFMFVWAPVFILVFIIGIVLFGKIINCTRSVFVAKIVQELIIVRHLLSCISSFWNRASISITTKYSPYDDGAFLFLWKMDRTSLRPL